MRISIRPDPLPWCSGTTPSMCIFLLDISRPRSDRTGLGNDSTRPPNSEAGRKEHEMSSAQCCSRQVALAVRPEDKMPGAGQCEANHLMGNRGYTETGETTKSRKDRRAGGKGHQCKLSDASLSLALVMCSSAANLLINPLSELWCSLVLCNTNLFHRHWCSK